MRLARRQHSHRQPVAKQDPVSRQGRHPGARQQGAELIERIDRGHRQHLAGQRPLAHLAQQAKRLRQSELLARHRRDKAPAANLATGFQLMVDPQQVAPGRQPVRFTRQQAPAHHAVTAQQHTGNVLQRLCIERRCSCLLFARSRLAHQCPAAGVIHPADKGTPAASPGRARALARRRQQCAQTGEAVGVYQAHRHQLAKGILQFAAQQMRVVLQLIEEQRALGVQAFEHPLCP